MPAARDPFERVKAVVDARPGLVDAVVATAAVVTGLITTTAKSAGDVVYEPRDGFALTLVLLATVPLVFRSRAPVAVLVGCSASVVALSALGYAEGVLPFWLWVVAATVGSRRSLRTVLWCGAYVMVALLALLLSSRGGLSFTGYLSQVAMFSTAFAIGYSMQARRARMTALEERSQALEAGQEAASQRAVAHERLRIAQELHDVVAHSMSVIAVQAGTGAHVIDTDPDAARRALDAIADTSRSSLAELRALLGVLRGDDGRPDYAPAPGLADLDHLVGEVRAAGVPVELTVEGDTADVPPGAALAAYRIVQEALTNVLKHAGPASARVRVTHAPGALDLEVTDDGRGATVAVEPSGHGLVGMRERVAVYGGHLDAGPATTGGFRVRAHVPLGEVAP